MRTLPALCLALGCLLGGLATFWVDCAFPAEISFEWSPYKPGECEDCTSFDLWKNHNIIVPDIPITQTAITIPLEQEQEEDDYILTAKDPNQRSGFSTVIRVTEDDGPIITKITQIK